MKAQSLLVPSAVVTAFLACTAVASTEDAAKTVAALDTQYQAAVERNDWQAMDRIFHPGFTLVLGNGTVHTRQELLDTARTRKFVFEKQVEVPGTQVVRLYGENTATVTARLWLKGKRSEGQDSFDYELWFTDTYVRTDTGWRYAFGQASTALPK